MNTFTHSGNQFFFFSINITKNTHSTEKYQYKNWTENDGKSSKCSKKYLEMPSKSLESYCSKPDYEKVWLLGSQKIKK